jgi:hypothetical protein
MPYRTTSRSSYGNSNRRWQPKTVQVGAETILTTPRISLRDLKFATRGLYFQNDFVCDKEAQSCPVYFARHPAR